MVSYKSVSGLPDSRLFSELLCRCHPILFSNLTCFSFCRVRESKRGILDFDSDQGIFDVREGYPSDFSMRKHFYCWNEEDKGLIPFYLLKLCVLNVLPIPPTEQTVLSPPSTRM